METPVRKELTLDGIDLDDYIIIEYWYDEVPRIYFTPQKETVDNDDELPF